MHSSTKSHYHRAEGVFGSTILPTGPSSLSAHPTRGGVLRRNPHSPRQQWFPLPPPPAQRRNNGTARPPFRFPPALLLQISRQTAPGGRGWNVPTNRRQRRSRALPAGAGRKGRLSQSAAGRHWVANRKRAALPIAVRRALVLPRKSYWWCVDRLWALAWRNRAGVPGSECVFAPQVRCRHHVGLR